MSGRDRITFELDGWAVFDGGNEAEIREVAGNQVETRDGRLVFRRADGQPEEMTPGWVVYRPEGALRASACTAEAWAAMGGPGAA